MSRYHTDGLHATEPGVREVVRALHASGVLEGSGAIGKCWEGCGFEQEHLTNVSKCLWAIRLSLVTLYIAFFEFIIASTRL